MTTPPNSHITDLIFDAGGVIFTKGTEIVLQEFHNRFKIPQPDLLRVFSGNPKLDPQNKAGELYRTGKINRDQFWAAAKEQLHITDENQVREMEQMWLNAYVPIPGMLDILNNLQVRYRLTLWTGNVPERIRYLNQQYGLLKYFKITCYSYECGKNKEDDEFYNALARAIAPTKPQEAIVIDDKPQYVFKAIKAGFNAIHFKTPRQLVQDLKGFKINVNGPN